MGSRSRRDVPYDEGYFTDHDASRRRHKSTPPKTSRARSPVKDDTPQRPKYAKDDSYYNPRDKYYLSGDDQPGDHPYFSRQREDRERGGYSSSRLRGYTPSPSRYRSPSPDRRRHEHRRHSPSPPRRYRSPSPDRHNHHGRHHHHDEEEEGDRRSRHSKASSTRRSMTAAPPSHGDRPSRRESKHYPPSVSRPTAHRKRSSTVPSSSGSRRPRSPSRSTSRSPTDKSPKDLLFNAARTALEAGAVAAVKMRDDPSPWIGMKGTKVVTTALGAALVDTFIEGKKPQMKGGMRHAVAKQVATVALGNLVTKPAVKQTRMGRKG